MNRVLAALALLVGMSATANAQGYSRGYRAQQRPPAFSYYQFNNGVSGYGVQTPSYGYYQFNNGVSGYSFGSRNFQYYQFNAPQPRPQTGFGAFPRVGF